MSGVKRINGLRNHCDYFGSGHCKWSVPYVRQDKLRREIGKLPHREAVFFENKRCSVQGRPGEGMSLDERQLQIGKRSF